ncbi:MAG: type I glyceraldehyde-3-phosphate dehydrogenase [Patescibacteria group bacterium]
MNIAINGFGRIGRTAAKILLEKKDAKLVAVNDLTDDATLAHLFKYDSNYGTWSGEISADPDGEHLIINGEKVPSFAEKDPTKLPWKDLGVDVVLECTGFFTEKEAAMGHITAGAKRVIISAPPKGSMATHIISVNEGDIKSDDPVISNASCTTNCITPVVAVINRQFGVLKAMMTTIHSYTADQNLQDGPHKDLRRARAAAENIVPTTTGAAISTTEVIPELKGLFDGLAIRVPTSVGSLSDITFIVKKKTTIEEVNEALKNASQEPRFNGIMEVTNQPLVSRDIVGNPASAIVDLELTKVVDGDMVKVVAWYDNEYGYSCRLVELAILAAPKR